jgi:NitT/TauT family transport system ATP-binding protein
MSVDTAALHCAGVYKAFPDGTVALHDVGLTVEPGEFVTVVGPAGCGKSTLVQVVAGLIDADGRVRAPAGRIGYLTGDATLLPWRDVRANVGLLAELHGGRTDGAAVDAAIDLAGLRGHERHLPRALAPALRARVALARALVGDPVLLCLDEPFADLDRAARQDLHTQVLRLVADRGIGVLLLTRSVSDAVAVSDRVLVMSGAPGRIVAGLDVAAPRPRTAGTPEFRRLVGEVLDALHAEDGPIHP